MYKKSFLSLMVMLLFVATSCSSEEPAAIESGGTISGDAGKTLIVYFSWGGNTRTVANHIHDLIGGDIVEVETVVPYPDTYEEVTQIAPGELESDYRPELKTKVENMDEYDTLIVGTPIWGGHLTPAMKSFLAGYDLSGKSIAWRQWYGSKRQRYPFGMPQFDNTRKSGRIWQSGGKFTWRCGEMARTNRHS